MSWLRLDDGYHDHPKIIRAGRDARDLDLAGMAWCARYLTDGRIPREALVEIAGKAKVRKPEGLAERLVAVGRWEVTEDGWAVHDYLEYNPSREEVLADREATRQRVKDWREKRRQRNASATSGNAVTQGVSPPPVTPLVTLLPTHDPSHGPSTTHDPLNGVSANGTSKQTPSSSHPSNQPRAERPRLEEPDGSPLVERVAYEVADQLGETRQRKHYWVDLSALFRGSGLSPPEFEERVGLVLRTHSRRLKRGDGDRRAAFLTVLNRAMEA